MCMARTRPCIGRFRLALRELVILQYWRRNAHEKGKCGAEVERTWTLALDSKWGTV